MMKIFLCRVIDRVTQKDSKLEDYILCQIESPSCKDRSSVKKRSMPSGDKNAVSQELVFNPERKKITTTTKKIQLHCARLSQLHTCEPITKYGIICPITIEDRHTGG